MRTTARAIVLLIAVVVGATGPAATVATTPGDHEVEASLTQLDRIVVDAMADTGVPGVAVAVVFGDEPVVTRGYGVRNSDTGEPVDAETVFQIASLSKAVTSTIIASVVGDGTIDWDDPVVDANPEFRLSDEWVSERVSYADLLAMRSGLPGETGNVLESIGYDRSQILERLRFVDLAPFRDTYSYSNFGFTAAGESAAKAVGMSWEDLAQERFFGPAGMASTSARHADHVARDNRADLHVLVDGDWRPRFERMPDAQSPAGGDSSNVVDLARWVGLVLGRGSLDGEQIVDPDALARVTTPTITRRPPRAPGGPTAFYGLGWNIDTDPAGYIRWNHSGAFSVGAATSAVLVPELGIGIVVLTNGQPIGLPEAIADAYLELLETGSVTQDWVSLWQERMAGIYGTPLELPEAAADGAPLRPLGDYAGTYANEYVGDIGLVAADVGLALVMGPARLTFPLASLDAETFTYVHDPELPEFLSTAVFTFGSELVADSVEVSTFADVGFEAFERT